MEAILTNKTDEAFGPSKYGVELLINPEGVPNESLAVIDVETDEKGGFVGIGIMSNSTSVNYYSNLRPDVRNFLSITNLIGHNLKFDARQLHSWGVDIKSTQLSHDTMLKSYVCNSTKESHGLKDLAKEYLQMEWPTYKEMVGGGRDKVTLDKQEVEKVAMYCGDDCVATFRLNQYLDKRMNPAQRGYYNMIELPIMQLLFAMELRGVTVDVPYLKELKEEMSHEAETLLANLRALINSRNYIVPCRKSCPKKAHTHDFNPASPLQVKEALNFFGYQLTNADKQALEPYHSDEFVNLLMEYRKINKVVGTFLEAWLALPTLPKIHTTFSQVSLDEQSGDWKGIRTGRLSCVPRDSEILTRTGWKRYNELTLGEDIMGFDIVRNQYKWSTLEAVHTGEEEIGLIKVNKGHDSKYRNGILCTGNHKWLAKNSKVIGLAEAKGFPRKFNLVLQPRASMPPSDSSYLTPFEAGLFGWYLTDGYKRGVKRYRLEISLVKSSSISILKQLLRGIPHKIYRRKMKNDSHYITHFSIGCDIFDPIYKKAIRLKPAELILHLDKLSREAMFQAMLEADGSMRRNTNRYDRFGSELSGHKQTNEYFELLSLAEGQPWNIRTIILPSGTPFINYQLFKNDELLSDRNSDWTPLKKMLVWCPQTACGMWVMRQNNYIVVTGNSKEPNLQQISKAGDSDEETTGKALRSGFIPSPEKDLVVFDFDQMQYRILAHYTKEPVLLNAFKNGKDVHEETARILLGRENITKKERSLGKSLNFGAVFGSQPEKIAEIAHVSLEEAEKFYKLYWQRLPGVTRWIYRTKALTHIHKSVKTILGRVIPLPGIDNRNRFEMMHAERQAVNFIIQGSEADIIKLGMLQVTAKGYMPILQVHDELHFETAPEQTEKAIVEIKQILENIVNLDVPLVANGGFGKSWFAAKS